MMGLTEGYMPLSSTDTKETVAVRYRGNGIYDFIALGPKNTVLGSAMVSRDLESTPKEVNDAVKHTLMYGIRHEMFSGFTDVHI